MTKVVVSHKGKFEVTLHLMKEYWIDSVDYKNTQPCFIIQHRPDLMMVAEFQNVVDNLLSLTWDGKNPDMLYDITTQELMIFSDTLSSRTDPQFVAVVERSLKQNHHLEVIEVPSILVERGWQIVWSEEQNRELVELKLQ